MTNKTEENQIKRPVKDSKMNAPKSHKILLTLGWFLGGLLIFCAVAYAITTVSDTSITVNGVRVATEDYVLANAGGLSMVNSYDSTEYTSPSLGPGSANLGYGNISTISASSALLSAKVNLSVTVSSSTRTNMDVYFCVTDSKKSLCSEDFSSSIGVSNSYANIEVHIPVAGLIDSTNYSTHLYVNNQLSSPSRTFKVKNINITGYYVV